MSSKIVIERTSQWVNRLRSIDIYAAGKKIGSVKNGEIKEFDINPGINELTAKIDWCKTNPLQLTVKQDETKQLALGSDIKGLKLFALLYYVLIKTRNYIYLKEK